MGPAFLKGMTDSGKTLRSAALWPATPCRHVDSSAGETRCPAGSGVTGRVSVSSSRCMGRFLNGSLDDGLPAELMREAPLSASGGASLTRPLQFGVPWSRIVVRRSNGAAVSSWWSPFMVMIRGAALSARFRCLRGDGQWQFGGIIQVSSVAQSASHLNGIVSDQNASLFHFVSLVYFGLTDTE